MTSKEKKILVARSSRFSQGICEQVGPGFEQFGTFYEGSYQLTSANFVETTSNFNCINMLVTKKIYLEMEVSKQNFYVAGIF